jgi:uncharacterized protein YllA (UPF0747 family)
MGKEIKIAFHPSVVDYLEQLTFTLYKKGYFGFIDSAINYIDKMIDFINKNIDTRPRKKAPAFFDVYGRNMNYITYQSNKQTTWYIFFIENDNRYLIKYITNNYVSGHLFDDCP